MTSVSWFILKKYTKGLQRHTLAERTVPIVSLRFVGKYADGLVEFGKDFLQFGIGLLYYEGGEVLGLALLHLSGLHNVGVAVAIGIEPADKKAATKCLTAVACFANIEQYVRVGGEKGLNQQQDGLAKLLVERRGLMALITDGKLVGASLPDRVVVHETDDEDLAAVGLNEVVAAVLRPDLVGSEAVDACQVKCVHAFRCSVEVVPDGFSLFPVLPVPATRVSYGWIHGKRR